MLLFQIHSFLNKCVCDAGWYCVDVCIARVKKWLMIVAMIMCMKFAWRGERLEVYMIQRKGEEEIGKRSSTTAGLRAKNS